MNCYRQIVLTFVLLMGLFTVPAWARQSTRHSDEDVHKWYARAAYGSARIHEWDPKAAWIDIRVGRAIGSHGTSIDGGIAGGGGSRSGFGTLTAGLEYRLWQQSRVSPFVRGEIGYLVESDFAGLAAGAGGGLTVRLGPRLGLRAGAALNAHGSARGPVTTYGGLEFRW